MKLNDRQMQRLSRMVLEELKSHSIISLKVKEEVLLQRMVEIVKANFLAEEQLDREVNQMMDDLERKNPGEFQRYKMFPLLKKRLAQQKGIVL